MITLMVMTMVDARIEKEKEIMDIIELEIEDKIIEVMSAIDLTTKLKEGDTIANIKM